HATVSDAGPCIEDTVDPRGLLPGANTSGCQQTSATATVQNIKGETIPGATPNKISFNTLYTFNFDPGKLTLSGTVIWRDGTFWNVFNRPYSFAPQNSQVNLRATWTDAKDRYNIILFANNLFNSIGYDGSAGTLLQAEQPGHTPDILTSPALTAEREFGIQFQYRWK
ncbi:MAG TPA: hypothetical protein VGG29_14485, partial [Caulobacteraceae bacterium]